MNNFWHDLPRPFFILAPMEAVTDVVFRHVIAKAGSPDVCFTNLLMRQAGYMQATKPSAVGSSKPTTKQPIVAHIWGGVPEDMEQLAAHCRELGFDRHRHQYGLPATKRRSKSGGGAALIRNTQLAAEAIAAAKTAGYLSRQNVDSAIQAR